MIRHAVFATGLAALLTLSAAAQEPHASTATTPDTPVSVTENKNIQQQTGNGTTDTKDSQKSLQHQEKSAKEQAKQNKEEAKAAKAQRKALKAQDKANKEAMKTKQ